MRRPLCVAAALSGLLLLVFFVSAWGTTFAGIGGLDLPLAPVFGSTLWTDVVVDLGLFTLTGATDVTALPGLDIRQRFGVELFWENGAAESEIEIVLFPAERPIFDVHLWGWPLDTPLGLGAGGGRLMLGVDGSVDVRILSPHDPFYSLRAGVYLILGPGPLLSPSPPGDAIVLTTASDVTISGLLLGPPQLEWDLWGDMTLEAGGLTSIVEIVLGVVPAFGIKSLAFVSTGELGKLTWRGGVTMAEAQWMIEIDVSYPFGDPAPPGTLRLPQPGAGGWRHWRR